MVEKSVLSENIISCPHCGCNFENNMKICTECGAKISSVVIPSMSNEEQRINNKYLMIANFLTILSSVIGYGLATSASGFEGFLPAVLGLAIVGVGFLLAFIMLIVALSNNEKPV